MGIINLKMGCGICGEEEDRNYDHFTQKSVIEEMEKREVDPQLIEHTHKRFAQLRGKGNPNLCFNHHQKDGVSLTVPTSEQQQTELAVSGPCEFKNIDGKMVQHGRKVEIAHDHITFPRAHEGNCHEDETLTIYKDGRRCICGKEQLKGEW